MDQADPMHIDIVSDVMCPWCYIGKRRLEKALATLPEIPVKLRWLPFQLDETLPREGKDRQTYLNEKFGGPDRAEEVYAPIRDAGAAEGIPFAFDKIQVSPNTLDCHRLILWARADNAQSEMAERLFQMYFPGRRGPDRPRDADPGLRRRRHDVGPGGGAAADGFRHRQDPQGSRQGREIGVTGVPAFIIDERFLVMGAEKPETLAAAIKHAHETKPGD